MGYYGGYYGPYIIGSYGPSYSDMERYSLQQRAQNIEDMFGAKPTSIREFRKDNIHHNWAKAIALTVVGVAAGAALAALLVESAALITTLAVIGGLFGGAISLGSEESAVRQSYKNYLSDFAVKARAAYEKQGADALTTTPEQNNTKARKWTEEVAASRENLAATGVVPG